MPTYFFDTSAFAKSYHPELGTAKVTAILSDANNRNLISSLTVVEMQSVFAQKVRGGDIQIGDFQAIRRKLGGDIRANRISVKGLLRRHQHAAEKLLVAHAPFRRLRTLDALQLAVSIELRTTDNLDAFVVADQHLAEVARLEGLTVINPEVP